MQMNHKVNLIELNAHGATSCHSTVAQICTVDWLIASRWTYPQASRGPEHKAGLPVGSLAVMWHHPVG